ncbi:MAG: DUF6056 family protein [Oscillospiraceae bacterium]|jgi:hypothetical protein|nr:DUF6056 family protein [Oscillospiraceae bacterium]
MSAFIKKIFVFRRSPWLVFLNIGAAIVFFMLAFPRLLVKTDDGHFLGILSSPSFQLDAWLTQRYQTLSGRTLSEGLMMTFLRQDLFWWKLFSAALLLLAAWIACKIALAFPGTVPARARIAFASGMIFLVLPTCLNAAAFWFAGSFTYLWPLCFVLLTCAACAFAALEIPCKAPLWLFACLAAPFAAMQEQAAVLVLALLLCLNAVLLRQKRWRLRFALPLLPAGVGAFFLFSAPGMRLRNAAETGDSFSAFAQMRVLQKLFCGFANYAGYAFFLSLPVMTLFLALLLINLNQLKRSRVLRFVTVIHAVAWVILCVGGNLLYAALAKTTPELGFQRMFERQEFDWLSLALLLACFLFFACVAALLVLLLRLAPKTGFATGLCCAACVGTALMLGFSGSIFASGQRIFFFADFFLLLACAILLGSATHTKAVRRVLQAALAIGALFFCIDALAFLFMEIPPMG